MEVPLFFMKGMKDIKCSINLWVFQVHLAGIVLAYSFRIIKKEHLQCSMVAPATKIRGGGQTKKI